MLKLDHFLFKEEFLFFDLKFFLKLSFLLDLLFKLFTIPIFIIESDDGKDECSDTEDKDEIGQTKDEDLGDILSEVDEVDEKQKYKVHYLAQP